MNSLTDLINKLLKELAVTLKPPKPPPVPIVKWYGCSPAEALAGIIDLSKAWPRDPWYWMADADTCIEWLKEAHSQMPKYKSITKKQHGFDCDKFAHWLVSFFYFKEHVRIWEVWGKTPQGWHAWNVLDNQYGRFEVEPQGADMWPIGENPKYEIVEYVIPKWNNQHT